jgi:AAA domain
MREPPKHRTDQSELSSALTGFAARVSRYFLDFLETDFKRQRAPHRRIQLKNDSGFRTGLPLRKYPTLYEAVWKLLYTPVGELPPLRLSRGRHTSPISPTLRDLIRQHVESLEASDFEVVREETLNFARHQRGAAVENPEDYVEDVQSFFAESVGKRIVSPILALLDGPFRQQSYSAIESVYEVETDLVDALAVQVVEQLPTTLNTYLVSSDLAATERLLEEFFSKKDTTERIKSFFEDFATADAYQELRDLTNYMRLGGESLEMYLYICELRFGTALFPIFYIPALVTIDERNGDLVVEFDPHLFIHKRAIDYITQERGSSAARLALSPIDNRIIYLDPQKPFVDDIERVLIKKSPTFDLSGDFDVRQPKIQTLASANLRLSKTAYFAVFDKSDESLLNDYEALLTAVREEQRGVTDLFQHIIRGFLIDEPASVREQVSEQWDRMPIPDRLVAVSPIPLNEEQRQIIMAIDDPDCRFVTVQGPPGTGKSHTITAIAFNCILNGKNVLILSDKQEALDVVEGKLKSALASVRQDDDFPDPILRLGKTGNTYTRLISQPSQEKIRNQYRAVKSHVERLSAETETTNQDIRRAITQTIDAYTSVSLNEVEELHQLEAQIEARTLGCTKMLQSPQGASDLVRLESMLEQAANAVAAHEFFSRRFASGLYEALLSLVRGYAAVTKLDHLRPRKPALSLFDPLGPQHQPVLQRLIGEYDELRMPIVGYLFRGSKVRALNARAARNFLALTA